MTPYNENSALANYVRRWYADLFTHEERNIPSRKWLIENVPDATLEEIDELIWDYQDGNGESKREKLVNAVDRFVELGVKRVMLENSATIVVNRCSKCNQIAASPNAQQCLWCGHDWHKTNRGITKR